MLMIKSIHYYEIENFPAKYVNSQTCPYYASNHKMRSRNTEVVVKPGVRRFNGIPRIFKDIRAIRQTIMTFMGIL